MGENAKRDFYFHLGSILSFYPCNMLIMELIGLRDSHVRGLTSMKVVALMNIIEDTFSTMK